MNAANPSRGTLRLPFRKLRIAWSIVGGILCVLLIWLWVRSYWWQNVVIWQSTNNYVKAASLRGRVLFERVQYKVMSNKWTIASSRLSDQEDAYQDENGQQVDSYWFHIMRYKAWNQYVVPDWFIVFITVCLTFAPWLRWRFSLRTLLIATTLVAVVLGLAVWATRN